MRKFDGTDSVKRAPMVGDQATIIPGNNLNVKKGVAVKNDAWNQINVRTFGVNQVTVSLGPKMIDWELPVLFRVNGTQWIKRVIQPNLATLLEDFYLRGDRQRLFFAQLEFKP